MAKKKDKKAASKGQSKSAAAGAKASPVRHSTPVTMAPVSAGFSLCRIASGPEAGKVNVLNISGQSLVMDGHRTVIRFSVYKNPAPADPPLGLYSAPIDPTDFSYSYDKIATPVTLDNPCASESEVKLTLVVNHIFEPIDGGVVQMLCEKIEKQFDCPITPNC